jgi:hypothetical protein
MFKEDGGKELFDDKYVLALADGARALEKSEIKLTLCQFAISAFIILGLLSSDASISLFGVSLKQATGLKEILVALSATLAVATIAVSQSKQLRLSVIDRLIELKTDAKFVAFAKLAAPASFNLQIYVARQFDKWIFPTLLTKSTMILLALLLFALFVSLFALSIALSVYLNVEIFRKPSLGDWSYVALGYTWLAYVVSVLWLIRAHFPLPFKDMHVIQELEALRKTDPAAYARRLQEVYGA